jgi:cold shock CspA family protein
MKGKISKYLSYRGYGFISVEEREKDIFFHMSKYPATEMPTQGQLLEFTVEETPKGEEAVNIKIVQEDSEKVEEIVTEPAEKVEVVPSEVPQSSVNDLDELNGIGPKYRKLLEKAKVQSRQEISGYSPEALLANLLSVNEKEQITKRPPTLTQVNEWISLANISVD